MVTILVPMDDKERLDGFDATVVWIREIESLSAPGHNNYNVIMRIPCAAQCFG